MHARYIYTSDDNQTFENSIFQPGFYPAAHGCRKKPYANVKKEKTKQENQPTLRPPRSLPRHRIHGSLPRRPHRHLPVLRRAGAERGATVPGPVARRGRWRLQDLPVQFLDRHRGPAFARRHVLEQAAEGVGGPDGQEGVDYSGRGAGAVAVAVVAVAGPEARHGRDVLGQQVADCPGRQERVVRADDEPGGCRGEDVRGHEARRGADDDGGPLVRRRRVVDGFDVLGDLVRAGEVEGVGFGFVPEGDVEGCGEGEGLHQLLERVLVGGSAVFVREEVLGGSHPDGGSAGDEEGFDVQVVGHGHGHGHGRGGVLCFWFWFLFWFCASSSSSSF